MGRCSGTAPAFRKGDEVRTGQPMASRVPASPYTVSWLHTCKLRLSLLIMLLPPEHGSVVSGEIMVGSCEITRTGNCNRLGSS